MAFKKASKKYRCKRKITNPETREHKNHSMTFEVILIGYYLPEVFTTTNASFNRSIPKYLRPFIHNYLI
jgi:hypothetical protein